jgi:multidrug resistance efflux pump
MEKRSGHVNKKWLIGIGAVVVILLIGAVALFSSRPTEPATETTAITEPAVVASSDVVADARVVPVRYAALGFPSSGTVAEILVGEGDTIEAGTVIARLGAARQQAAVAEAEAAVARAEARLAELKAGARTQEVEAAAAAVQAAEAQLARLEQGSRAEDIRAADAELAAARARLQKAQDGADEQQLIAARADLANAEAALQQAQAAYDRVQGDPNIGALPQALQLQQATNNYNAAKARYDDLAAGSSAADIATARAQVQRAQATLDTLRAPARAADLAAAQAEIRRAQAQLDLLSAGARTETIAAAEADVAAAQAGLEQARAALADTELRAPFAGSVAGLDMQAGEQIAAGTPVVQLGDLSAWLIETNDLTELSVVRIQEGSPATVSFDAIPDLELPGTVTEIKGFGESKQGDITYTVVVTPSQGDPRLRWNMTASVAIETE